MSSTTNKICEDSLTHNIKHLSIALLQCVWQIFGLNINYKC